MDSQITVPVGENNTALYFLGSQFKGTAMRIVILHTSPPQPIRISPAAELAAQPRGIWEGILLSMASAAQPRGIWEGILFQIGELWITILLEVNGLSSPTEGGLGGNMILHERILLRFNFPSGQIGELWITILFEMNGLGSPTKGDLAGGVIMPSAAQRKELEKRILCGIYLLSSRTGKVGGENIVAAKWSDSWWGILPFQPQSTTPEDIGMIHVPACSLAQLHSRDNIHHGQLPGISLLLTKNALYDAF
ncbi:hypothetical protein B0H13DRAFT_1862205 [Mycena leptocephala]|nr:hypothetical protein B0H13DRAFT_1862205 [Mycena leptocephala]